MYGGSKFYELRNLTNKEGLLAVSQGNLNIYPIEDMDARFYVCRMDWSRKEPEQLEKEFTAVCDGLKALAEIYRMGEIPFGECPAPEYISEDSSEMEVWNTYIKGSVVMGDPEKCKGEIAEPEDRYSDEVREKVFDLAETRIGKGADRRQTWRTWNRGMRYCQFFMRMQGSDFYAVEKEEESFAVDFALHACAKEIKFVNLYKDHYDPETKLYGEVDDAEMEQLLLYLEASPQYLQGEGVGHLLLLNKIYAKEQTKLCDLAFHDFFDVKYFCAGLVFELSEGERRCIESIYGLDLLYDRTSEAEFGEDNGLSGGKVYEIEATAIRKLRHPSRMEKIRRFIEAPEIEE